MAKNIQVRHADSVNQAASPHVACTVYAISSRLNGRWWGGRRGWVKDERDALRFATYTEALCLALEHYDLPLELVTVLPVLDDMPACVPIDPQPVRHFRS